MMNSTALMAICGTYAAEITAEAAERRRTLGTVDAASFRSMLEPSPINVVIAGTQAIVRIHGPLAPHVSGFDALFFEAVSTNALEAEIRALGEDETIDNIILDIHSPGGSTQGIPELAATIRSVRKAKRITAVANFNALSAAYWIATQAHEIVALESSFLGAMGAFFQHVDESEAIKSAGLTVTTIAVGDRKTEFMSTAPLDETAIARAQELVDLFFNQFVDDVAEGRGMDRAKVLEAFGSSRVFTAAESFKLGMIDRISAAADLLTNSPTARSSAASARAEAADQAELMKALGRLKTTIGG